MTLTPRLRRFVLTAHITASVGWLGAVAGFLALAIVGLTSESVDTVRGAYLSMEPMGWFVLVPLAIASLVTGLVQSLGTKWGLFRHYWVVITLFINLLATGVLLMYMQTLGSLADRAALSGWSDGNLSALRSASPVLHAGAALVLLLIATGISVYKPRGVTRYGWRKQQERRAAPQT